MASRMMDDVDTDVSSDEVGYADYYYSHCMERRSYPHITNTTHNKIRTVTVLLKMLFINRTRLWDSSL